MINNVGSPCNFIVGPSRFQESTETLHQQAALYFDHLAKRHGQQTEKPPLLGIRDN